jgi:hypothetical protein
MSERRPLVPHLHSDLKAAVHDRYDEKMARPVGVSCIIAKRVSGFRALARELPPAARRERRNLPGSLV